MGPRQTCAIKGLGLVVTGEHAEADRDAGVDGDSSQAVGGSAADVVEVRRATADDDAERHDGVVARGRQRLGDDRKLEGAGNTDDVVGGTDLVESALRRRHKAVHHLDVPGRGHDGHPQPACGLQVELGGSGAAHEGVLSSKGSRS